MTVTVKKLLYASTLLLVFLSALTASILYSRSWQHCFFIDPVYRIDTDRKLVALTFDDGPSAVRTPALLELLGRYNVKATFFMLGENIEKYPGVAKEVSDRGHLIGNHSYNHPRMVLKSHFFIIDQVRRTDLLIKALGQGEVRYFRPPYTVKYIILPLVIKSMDKKLVTGTFDPPGEYASPFDGKKVAARVIANTKPGSIIFLHDGKNSDREQFVKAVELIITGLRGSGYEFVRLDCVE